MIEVCNGTISEIFRQADSGCVVIQDYVYICLALFMFAIFIIGLLFNGSFLYILLFHNKLRARTNIYIGALCVTNILIGVLAIPFVGASAISRHWLFGNNGCIFHGFIVTWLGLIQICILSAISIEKYLRIVRRIRDDFLTYPAILTLVGACVVYSGMLAAYPLFGWNEYSFGALDISCEINLMETSANYHSYVFCLLILGMAVPLTIILFCYIKILVLVRRQRKHMFEKSSYGKQKAKEMKVIKTVFLFIVVFMLSWIPYSCLIFAAMFYPYQSINPVLATVPALFAKSSIIWNPIIYLMTNTIFKKAFVQSIPCLRFMCKTEVKKIVILNKNKGCKAFDGKSCVNASAVTTFV